MNNVDVRYETLFDERIWVSEKNDVLSIRLESYPISFIRIVKDTRHRRYAIILRDKDGCIVKMNKTADNGLLTVTMLQLRRT